MSTRTLRERIGARFSDEDLRTLCFDEFRPVYEQLSAGMTKTQLIQLLLDHCARRPGEGARLLDVLERERPGVIGADRDALLAALDAGGVAGGAGPGAVAQRIDNQAPNYGAQGVFNGSVTINAPPRERDEGER